MADRTPEELEADRLVMKALFDNGSMATLIDGRSETFPVSPVANDYFLTPDYMLYQYDGTVWQQLSVVA